MSYVLVIPPKILNKIKKLDTATKERILRAISEIVEKYCKYLI